MNLKYDLPEGADGPRYPLSIEFDETRLRFYAIDDSDSARESEGSETEWTEIGEWRDASLWLARQLFFIGSPVMRGIGGTVGSPSRVARDLTDEETLVMLGNPPNCED